MCCLCSAADTANVLPGFQTAIGMIFPVKVQITGKRRLHKVLFHNEL